MAMRRADADADVDVVILTGADPAFCAGLDLKELGSGEHDVAAGAGPANRPPASRPDPDDDQAGHRRHQRRRHHRRLRARAATATSSSPPSGPGSPTPTRGSASMPGWGLTVLLAEAVGVRRARELSATGNFLDAPTALRVGPREPRRSPRRTHAVLPAARRRHRLQRPGRRAAHPAHLRRAAAGRRRPMHGTSRPAPAANGCGAAADPRRDRGSAPLDHGAWPGPKRELMRDSTGRRGRA